MLTFLSGDKELATTAGKSITHLFNLVEQMKERGQGISVLKLSAMPGFSLLPKGDYRLQIDAFKDQGPQGRPCVFNGQTSYIDWIATVKYHTLIVMGLEPLPCAIA